MSLNMKFPSFAGVKTFFLSRANNDIGVRLKLQSWKVRDRVALGEVAVGGKVTAGRTWRVEEACA